MSDKLIGEMLGKMKSKYRNRPSAEWVLPDTTLGIEVEIEGTDFARLPMILPPGIQHYWAWHEDQSLHNGGTEFTFRNPMFGEDAQIALQELLEFAQKQKWLVSKRTGIHIHMDARDMSRHQLLGLAAYYTLFEPAIYAWVGADRHANNFCLPYYKAEVGLKQAQDILLGMRKHEDGEMTAPELIRLCENYHRYAGLNLKSLATFGSLEFRQLQTSFDYARVRDWINLLLSIKRAALDVPESSMTILNDMLRYGPLRALTDTFRGNLTDAMTQENVLRQIETYGLPNAMSLLNVVSGVQRGPAPLTWHPTGRGMVDYEKTHKGMLRWKEKVYPKGLPEKPKEVKKQKSRAPQLGDILEEGRLPDELVDWPTGGPIPVPAGTWGGMEVNPGSGENAGSWGNPWWVTTTAGPSPAMRDGHWIRDILDGFLGQIEGRRFHMTTGDIRGPIPAAPEANGSRQRPWPQDVRAPLSRQVLVGHWVRDTLAGGLGMRTAAVTLVMEDGRVINPQTGAQIEGPR